MENIEDGSNHARNGHSAVELGDIALRVVLKVKLAALPRQAPDIWCVPPATWQGPNFKNPKTRNSLTRRLHYSGK